MAQNNFGDLNGTADHYFHGANMVDKYEIRHNSIILGGFRMFLMLHGASGFWANWTGCCAPGQSSNLPHLIWMTRPNCFSMWTAGCSSLMTSTLTSR